MDYLEFSLLSGVDGCRYDVRFRNLITGIAPRHSDTADVQFLVNEMPVVVALPLVALSRQKQRAGRPMSDGEVIHTAALILKETLEKQGVGEEGMITPAVEQTLEAAAKL